VLFIEACMGGEYSVGASWRSLYG